MLVWQFFNSALGLLLMGFVLTTVTGALLSARIQKVSWKRQMRLDLFKRRYDEGAQFLDALTTLIGKRFFALQRFLWAITDRDNYDLAETAKTYFKIVEEWNVNLRSNRNKIRLLIGQEQANAFLDYEDDRRP